MPTWLLSLLLACSVIDVYADCSIESELDSSEAYAKRSYFYAGGEYVNTTTASSDTLATYMVGQIYVERIEPLYKQYDTPLLFIAGAAQTGTNWLNTPDGRPGWATHFLRHGYTVFVTDQAQRGRSPQIPGAGNLTAISVNTVERQFTAPEKFPSYPQAATHTQWPGTGLAGDPTFDAFYASQVQYQSNATMQASYNNASYAALLDRIGPAIVFAHSQAGPFGWKLADVRPKLVKGLVVIEPEGPPFLNYDGPPIDPRYIKPGAGREREFGIALLPLEYDPPINGNASLLIRHHVDTQNANLSSCTEQAAPARQLKNVKEVPVLFLTSEASYHAVYDHCTVAYLRQAGVKVDYMDLPKIGIHGNGHFVFSEKNNMKIADAIRPWVERHADAV